MPVVVGIGVVLGVSVAPAWAAQLEAFASVEAGHAGSCITGPVFLPGGDPYSGSYGIPADFQACGFSADSGVADHVVSTGTASANWMASDAMFSGLAEAHASYGSVGASASGTSTRQGNFLGNASGAFGVFTDTLLVTSATHGTGANGSVVFEFAVDGQLAVDNGDFDPQVQILLGHADALLAVRLGTQLANVFRAQSTLFGNQAPSTNPPGAAGFTATQGATGWTLDGSTTAQTGKLPIQFGTPVVFTAGLLAEAYPQTASTATGAASVDFFTTATLTGIQVFDVLQQPVDDAQVSAESGTQYVPEADPDWAALGAGMTLLGVRTRKRRSAFR